MPHLRPAAALTQEELGKALDNLSFGAGAEGIETLLDLLVLPVQGNSDARAKAARRTRIYKVRQIIKKAPAQSISAFASATDFLAENKHLSRCAALSVLTP